MLSDRQAFAQREALAVDRDGRGIGRDDLTVECFEGDRAARADADAQAGGGEAVRGRRHLGARLALLGQHRPTGVFGIRTVARDTHTHQAVGKCCQAHLERACRYLDAIALGAQRRSWRSGVRGGRAQRQRGGGQQGCKT